MAAPVHPKVQAVAVAGAVVTIAVAIAGAFGHPVPPDVVAAVMVLATTGAGYFKAAPAA